MSTSQRNLIKGPVAGMVIYNTHSTCIEIYGGSNWFNVCSVVQPLFSGTVVTYAPVAVTKSSTKRVFVHLMPWFETPATNSGNWGIH